MAYVFGPQLDIPLSSGPTTPTNLGNGARKNSEGSDYVTSIDPCPHYYVRDQASGECRPMDSNEMDSYDADQTYQPWDAVCDQGYYPSWTGVGTAAINYTCLPTSETQQARRDEVDRAARQQAELDRQQQQERDRLRKMHTGSSYDDEDPCRYAGAYYEGGVRKGAGLTPEECRQADQEMKSVGLDPTAPSDYELYKDSGALEKIAPAAYLPPARLYPEVVAAAPMLMPPPTSAKPFSVPPWAWGAGVAAAGLLAVPLILRSK